MDLAWITDHDGCIGRIHGPERFKVIRDTVDRLESFVAAHEGPKVWVRADYSPGRFSEVDLQHALGYLCVPGQAEHDWEPHLRPPTDAVGSVDAVFITGFWLTACVAATAIGCAERLEGQLPVVVPLSLAATRAGLYDVDDDHPADVDVTAVLQRLRSGGVIVGDSPSDWTPRVSTR